MTGFLQRMQFSRCRVAETRYLSDKRTVVDTEQVIMEDEDRVRFCERHS
jgi:hypothetical protein